MLRSTYTPLAPLPSGWTEHKAPSGTCANVSLSADTTCIQSILTGLGHVYYYNTETKQSTYRRPAAPAPEPEPEPQPGLQAIQAQYPAISPPIFQAPGQFGPPSLHGTPPFDQRGHGGDGRRFWQPEDRPKAKHAIPGCEPWVLVKTKMGRRFVHNLETKESFWKYPRDVLKGVIEYDRIERQKKERRKRGEASESEEERPKERERTTSKVPERERREEKHDNEVSEYDSDEYEEVEITDDEDGGLPSKRARTEEGDDQPLEFNEEDIAYQLASMGGDSGLDAGEHGETWEEGEEDLPLTEKDATLLFRDLLDNFRINPYTPFEKVIEDGWIFDDSRYTVLPNMKSRRDTYTNWSRDRIQERKEQKAKEEKKDPRIRYLALLHEYATPKLYWPEFKRKYRKEPEMKETKISEKEKEKLYRDHIARLKLPEGTRKSDLSALLKSIPLQQLNRSSTTDTLPSTILTDLRYISLPPDVRNPLVETFISTLAPAPEATDISSEEKENRTKKEQDRQRRERALAEREERVQEEKRKQRRDMVHGKDLLRQEDEEIQRAMRVGKEGLISHMGNAETDQ